MLRLGIVWTTVLVGSRLMAGSPAIAGDGSDDGTTGRRLAVIIGVENYDDSTHFPDLKFAAEDASGLADALMYQGYLKPDIRLLLGTKDSRSGSTARADRSSILRAIDQAIVQAGGSDDSLIIAFSGHGFEFRSEDGQFRSYFCPADSKMLKDHRNYNRDSMIDIEEVFERLKGCNAAMKLILVDACQNRPDTNGEKGLPELSGDSESRRDFLTRPRNTALFHSCQPGKKSFEVDELKHGLFMYCVIQAFKGEASEAIDPSTGHVTYSSLDRYVSNEVPKLCKKHDREEQIPILSGDALTTSKVVVRLERYRALLKKVDELVRKGGSDKVRALELACQAAEQEPQAYPTWLRASELGLEGKIATSRVIEQASKAVRLLERNPGAPAIDRVRARLTFATALHQEASAGKALDLKGLNTARDQLDAALKDLTSELLERNPRAKGLCRRAHFVRAQVAYELGDLDGARSQLAQVGELQGMPVDMFDPEWKRPGTQFTFQLLQARLFRAEGKFRDADAAVKQLLESAQKIGEKKGRSLQTARVEQALISRDQGRLDEAIDRLETALSVDPDGREAGLLLAELRIDRGDFQAAFDAFSRVYNSSDTPEALVGMARASVGLGQWVKAKELLETVKLADLSSGAVQQVKIVRAQVEAGLKSGNTEQAGASGRPFLLPASGSKDTTGPERRNPS